MERINYTEEMKAQDKLWETENENLEVMEVLFNQIITEAKNKGFEGFTFIYSNGNEMICQIFNNEKEKELADLGTFDDFEEVAYCKPLIEKLETRLNR